jgi:inner membrane protein YidH
MADMDSPDPSSVTGTPAGDSDGLTGTDSAPRRTWLAAERTYLAWLRTGLGALGLALAVGRLIPALVDVSHVEFGLLGTGYGVLGIYLFVVGAYRARQVRAALAAQRPLPDDARTMWVLTLMSIVLAACTIVLVLVEV